MGSLNIPEWSPDQVAEWMLGLGPKVAQYVPELRDKGLNGAKLLTLRCDDLEYLGINIIGHQELILEAVEHLRNFHYELSRECVQQLAVRVSTAAASLARALRCHADARLETQLLADVARTVHAVKPLVCWLDRWPLCSGSPLAERKAALLKLSLEAATCAQRDRFAEQPARAVAAAAAAVAAVADYIIQDVSDPMILQPASLDAVSLRQGTRPLGFEVVPSFCGHHQLADIRFASPAHASGLVHEADEIVQAGAKCVLGWSGEAVERACVLAARATGELQLRLRRRGARALPALPTPPLRAPRPRAARLRLPPLHAHLRLHRYELDFPRSETPPEKIVETETTAEAARTESPASSSDESEPLSPPASPTLHLDTTRMYPPKPVRARARRHSVSGGSPLAKRAPITVQQFWHELQQQRWVLGGSPEPDDAALYRRDKAVSCSTGLQLSPRPRTCLGVPRAPPALASPTSRGKLDKSHSTPAYDFEPCSEPGSLAAQTIPESPTTPINDSPTLPHLEKAGQILDFKKSSSQIEEAILQQRSRRQLADEEKPDIFSDRDIKLIDEDAKLEIVETVNIVLSERVQAAESEGSSSKRAGEDTSTSSDDQLPVTLR
nr:connector enhancer of kinase suppressor of ras 3-like [Maniola hyperantus]